MSDTNEEIVGRVLQGLRSAAPLDGMESRILSAVRHRTAAKPVPARLRWRIASLAGGVAVASVVSMLFFVTHRRMPQAALPRAQAVSMPAGNEPSLPPVAETRKPTQVPVRRVRLITASPRKEDALAVVSYPAPPMPLTEQEKLLLRLAHKGDAVQLAMLDPQQRAMRNAAEKAEFQQFFEPIIPGDHP